jgi:hypothetical protein
MSVAPKTETTDGTLLRKVTASGAIWLAGRAYYVSRRLAGLTIPVSIQDGKLVVEASVPLRKEYHLPLRLGHARCLRPGRGNSGTRRGAP